MAGPIDVIKIGGSTLGSHDTSLDDIAALHSSGRRLLLVHGGGATITDWLKLHGVKSRFVRGLRVTDEATLDVVVAVLAGLINKRLVAELSSRGARAIGLSGVDGAVLQARRYVAELGFVGEVTAVDATAVRSVIDGGAVAVVAPIAIEAVEARAGGTQAQLLNVNADTAAGELAGALNAERLVFLTDVPGVKDASGTVAPTLTLEQARALIDDQVASGGMIPKLEAALSANSSNVTTIIADGRESGALRLLLADETEPAGSWPGTRIG